MVLERHATDPTANQIILMNLIEMGLMRMGPNPDNPDDILLDSRPLQSVLAEYGPRVTTASGRLGVSATKNELWTPGGPSAGGGGALWTPGSDAGAASPAGGKSKLILPGRSPDPLREPPSTMRPPPDRDDPALAFVRQGWDHLKLQRPVAAWASWRRALRIDPDHEGATRALDILAAAGDLPLSARA